MPDGGCHGTNEWIEGIESDCCPVVYVGECSTVLSAAMWVDRGVLPAGGGYFDQPAHLIDLIDIAMSVKYEYEASEARRHHGR